MTFGERLKFFAKERYGGVGHFAHACGIHPAQMSKYISGTNEPMRPVLEKFSTAGVSLDWLIAGIGEMEAPQTDLVIDPHAPVGAYPGEKALSEIFELSDPDIRGHIEWMEETLKTLKHLIDCGAPTSEERETS